jgi:molybdopterin-synthase adenylyltransferase
MKEFSISIPYALNEQLKFHLIRDDRQEDLCFALWYPSMGNKRYTALLHSVILPEETERQIHGNVSFNPHYFKRVCQLAMKQECGIALLHSHPANGWQSMSNDDINAELKLAAPSETLTQYRFVGLTIGEDGTWSGRIWNYSKRERTYIRQYATNVRIVGKEFEIYYADFLLAKVKFKEHLKRTVNVWGKENHQKLARLRIGIVGLGSVGSIVAQTLARIGMQNIINIDFDKVETHNLDRLLGAYEKDLGKRKVDVINKISKKSATADNINFFVSPHSIANEKAYRAALDCDILFSCVDKPRARYILNHIAYNHLIPVIDGGIQVRFDENSKFIGAEWQLQTVGPDKPCLQCLGVYDPHEVQLEKDGLLEDASYLKGLPQEYENKKNNENIFPFSINLASLEVFHLIAMVTHIGNIPGFGIQRFRYTNGFISNYDKKCNDECTFQKTIAEGDKDLIVFDSSI